MASNRTARAAARAEARKAVRGIGVRVTVDGKAYEVYSGDLSALDIAACRRETGHSYLGLFRAARTDYDIDIVAAIVWLARRVKGERGLPFEMVAAEFDYDTAIETEDVSEVDTPDEIEAASRVIEGEVSDSPEA